MKMEVKLRIETIVIVWWGGEVSLLRSGGEASTSTMSIYREIRTTDTRVPAAIEWRQKLIVDERGKFVGVREFRRSAIFCAD